MTFFSLLKFSSVLSKSYLEKKKLILHNYSFFLKTIKLI